MQNILDEPKQFLKNWWSACTPADWRTLRSNEPWSAKLRTMVERANSIGCTHPDEQCCKWMLAMLLCACYSELPSPKEIYCKLQELKNCVVTCRKSYPFEHLIIYPQHINEEMKKHRLEPDSIKVTICIEGEMLKVDVLRPVHTQRQAVGFV